MLSDRRQIVLRALIEEYIARALPVGSRTLVERYNLGISSATVRNELSLLEEMGYLAQPHTSAGRIPTDFGYRAFVDELLSESDPDNGEDALARELRESASDLDDLMDRTSQGARSLYRLHDASCASADSFGGYSFGKSGFADASTSIDRDRYRGWSGFR